MAEPRKILVIMLRRIGDVLLTTPAVRALRRRFPKARIDFLVEPPGHEALDGNPDIGKILVYAGGSPRRYLSWVAKIRTGRYDWVIDYMGNPRSAVLTAASGAAVKAGPGHVSHRWAYTHRLPQSPRACYAGIEKIRVLRSLGLQPDESDFLPSLPVPEESIRWAKTALTALWPAGGRPGPLVGFVPASRKTTRRWPAASYAELGRRLRDESGARSLVFRGPGEEALAVEVARGVGDGAAVAPETKSLKELAALLGFCRLVVTNCNGPKHIAVARGVPTLTIHGSSDPSCWNPPGDPLHRIARLDDLFCIGCGLNACPYALECMVRLEPRRVARQALEMLAPAEPVG